ncbi:MAG: acyl-ACP--UDP-N-acetylglucosamine O-acyltransferase [Planctomycetota bacterium]|jgi:UDP-N-acetylglucosamine acyltransferase
MPHIHATALVEDAVDLADDVQVGPSSVLTGKIRIGAGTRIIGSAYLQGPLVIGENCLIYPFSSIGFAPQSVDYDPGREGRGVQIGDRVTIRESVSIHRAMTDAGPTTIGDECFLMANAHVGHDARLGYRCILANGALLGGHVSLGDRAFVGGNAAVHQFCRIGRLTMLSGGMAVSRDLPPFLTLTGMNVAGSINEVGLRRSGMSREDIEDVKWVFKVVYRRKLGLREAARVLMEKRTRPIVREFIDFIDESERGLCPGRPDLRRVVEEVEEEADKRIAT